MDYDDIREELNQIFEIGPQTAALLAAGTVGIAGGRFLAHRKCAKRYGKGTPEYKKCISMKNSNIGQTASAIKKKLTGKK